MAIQIVVDQTGDTRHWFNPDDTEALSKAEERFESLGPSSNALGKLAH